MPYVGLLCLTFCGGLTAAFAWAKFVAAVQERNRVKAACYDALIVLGGNVIQLASAGLDWRIVLTSAIASVIATYFAVPK